MRARPSRWFAVAATVLNAALLVAIVFLGDLADDPQRLANILNGIGLVPYLFIGPLLILRAPRNAIGWLFTFSSLLLMGGVVARKYANHVGAVLATPPRGPSLRSDLLGAVRQTMSPAPASLWLRER